MSQHKNPGEDKSVQHGQEYGRVHQVQEREHHDRNQLGQEKRIVGEINPNEHHGKQPVLHAAPENTGITVYINRKPYHAISATFTGADLRNLSNPPIGADENIFRVVSGKGDDIQLGDADVIAVDMRDPNQGRHFFSDTIIPTKDAVARRAYAIYIEDGSQPGHDAENWAKAEAELDTRPKQ